MHRNPETLTTLGSSGTRHLLPSWLLGFQREERDTQLLLCWLFHLTPPRAAHLVDPTGLASPRSKKSTRFAQVQILTHLPNKRARTQQSQLDSSRFKSQLTAFFFKNHPKSTAHRFRVWRHSHPQSSFLSGVFIIISVLVTSSPRECEHLRSMCAPTRALSRIILSLTKPKDKI